MFVNRIWQHHFGQGIVYTLVTSASTANPPHPELLDWLAADVKHGWDQKRLHRMIDIDRLPAVGKAHSELDAIDPENRLLAR